MEEAGFEAALGPGFQEQMTFVHCQHESDQQFICHSAEESNLLDLGSRVPWLPSLTETEEASFPKEMLEHRHLRKEGLVVGGQSNTCPVHSVPLT